MVVRVGAVWVGVRNKVCGSELCGSEWEMKCMGQSCVGRSENWSDERVDRRNEVVGQKWKKSGSKKWGWIGEKWADRSEKRKKKLTVRRVRGSWCVECRSGLRTECVVLCVECVDVDRSVDWIGAWIVLCVKCIEWIEAWIVQRIECIECVECRSWCIGVWIVLFGSVCGSELVKLCVRLRKDQCVWERSGKCLKWKFGLKIISVGFGLFYGQTENIFNLTQFTIPTKHAIFRKMISEFRFQSKQTDPKKKEIQVYRLWKFESDSKSVLNCWILD